MFSYSNMLLKYLWVKEKDNFIMCELFTLNTAYNS